MNIANISLAYPLISPSGFPAVPNLSGNAYTVITCKAESKSYEAMVFCGPANKVFVMGDTASNQRDAMVNLLHATSGLIHLLFQQGKLARSQAKNCQPLGGNGQYVNRMSRTRLCD